MRFTIDMDTGGTFTDGFFTADGQTTTVKVDTTPHDLTVCFSKCIEEGARNFGIAVSDMLRNTEVVRFSSTITSNAMITRSGPKIGLIVTRGFENSIYEESGQQNPVFDFVLSPSMVIGIDEEVDAQGNLIKVPGDEEVRTAVKQLLQRGARVIVVGLYRAAMNAANERRVRQIVSDVYPSHYLGAVPILLSTEISASSSDALRTNTAVVDAYFHRDMVRFLYKADEYLRRTGYRKPLLVVHSGGGAARVAKTVAIQTWGAGPAGGLAGAAFMSQLYGIENVISIDIGGTSTDIGLVVKGKYNFNYEPVIEGIRLGFPIVELTSIEGGGGSIISPRLDSKTVQVGPESAGGLPGPAAYDLGGTQPTVTDACIVLGYIDPNYFLGGKKKLNPEKARRVIGDGVAKPLGLSLEQAAASIIKETISLIANAIRDILLQKGVKPEDCTLFSFGGAGGIFCQSIASQLGIAKVLSFLLSPVFSAFGVSTMDVLHRYESARTLVLRSGSSKYLSRLDDFNEVVLGLKDQALRDMRGEGFGPEKVNFSLQLEIVGTDGSHIVESPRVLLQTGEDIRTVCDACTTQFTGDKKKDITARLFRLNASAPVSHYQPPSYNYVDSNPERACKNKRKVYWEEGFAETDIYEQNRLQCGNVVNGPAIIESEHTTVLVPLGHKYTVDKFLSGVLERA